MSDALFVPPTMSKLAWYQTIGKYARANPSKSLWQLVNTFVPYFVLLALMLYTVQKGHPYWVTLALGVLAGGFLVRVFILFHDCCHRSFFASRRANTILGYLSGILTFTPYEDWRYAHNIHHATAGNVDRQGVGDIWTMTKKEYLAATPRKRLAYRIYRNPFVLFGPGPALLFLCFQRFPTEGAGRKERYSVLFTNLALLAVVALATSTIGFQAYLAIQLPIILIASTCGLWLFYVQHQFESVYWARHESWDPLRVALEGSSYFKLPKILQWFTSNIGLHHVHHVRPKIPNYNLQQCHDDVAAFHSVQPVTIRTSFSLLRLGLYDETQKKLISFGSLKARRALYSENFICKEPQSSTRRVGCSTAAAASRARPNGLLERVKGLFAKTKANEDRTTYPQLIFVQNETNGWFYHGDDLPYNIWAWPGKTWFQERLNHRLKARKIVAQRRNLKMSDERGP